MDSAGSGACAVCQPHFTRRVSWFTTHNRVSTLWRSQQSQIEWLRPLPTKCLWSFIGRRFRQVLIHTCILTNLPRCRADIQFWTDYTNHRDNLVNVWHAGGNQAHLPLHLVNNIPSFHLPAIKHAHRRVAEREGIQLPPGFDTTEFVLGADDRAGWGM
jgi:hypothetical protein